MDGVISRKLEKSSFQLSQRICADTGLLRRLQSKIGFMVFDINSLNRNIIIFFYVSSPLNLGLLLGNRTRQETGKEIKIQ